MIDLEKMLPSNHIMRCAICGIPITKENDSGGEIFVGDGKYSQPICGWCDSERYGDNVEMQKEEITNALSKD